MVQVGAGNEDGVGARGASGLRAARLRVGSWPGRESRYNAFIVNFLDGLQAAGLEVVSLPDPAAFAEADVDILILHWLERLFWTAHSDLDLFHRVARFLRALRGLPEQTRIVWLVHNLAPHERRPLHQWMWRRLLPVVARRTDAVLTLSPGTVDQVRGAIPELSGCPALGCRHPAYKVSSDAPAGEIRRSLGVPEGVRVIGYVGNLRPYKGLDGIVQVFSQLQDPDLRLLLAGDAAAGDSEALRAMAAGDSRIMIEARRLDTAEYDARLKASDLIVAPFRNYLHSGSMIHALCAGRPLLTPDTPFARDLAGAVGQGWVTTYDSPLTVETLRTTLDQVPQGGAPDLAAFQPDCVGREVAAFLREVSASPRRARGGVRSRRGSGWPGSSSGR